MTLEIEYEKSLLKWLKLHLSALNCTLLILFFFLFLYFVSVLKCWSFTCGQSLSSLKFRTSVPSKTNLWNQKDIKYIFFNLYDSWKYKVSATSWCIISVELNWKVDFKTPEVSETQWRFGLARIWTPLFFVVTMANSHPEFPVLDKEYQSHM